MPGRSDDFILDPEDMVAGNSTDVLEKMGDTEESGPLDERVPTEPAAAPSPQPVVAETESESGASSSLVEKVLDGEYTDPTDFYSGIDAAPRKQYATYEDELADKKATDTEVTPQSDFGMDDPSGGATDRSIKPYYKPLGSEAYDVLRMRYYGERRFIDAARKEGYKDGDILTYLLRDEARRRALAGGDKDALKEIDEYYERDKYKVQLENALDYLQDETLGKLYGEPPDVIHKMRSASKLLKKSLTEIFFNADTKRAALEQVKAWESWSDALLSQGRLVLARHRMSVIDYKYGDKEFPPEIQKEYDELAKTVQQESMRYSTSYAQTVWGSLTRFFGQSLLDPIMTMGETAMDAPETLFIKFPRLFKNVAGWIMDTEMKNLAPGYKSNRKLSISDMRDAIDVLELVTTAVSAGSAVWGKAAASAPLKNRLVTALWRGTGREAFYSATRAEQSGVLQDLRENAKDENGKPLDRETAYMIALAAGTVNGMIEVWNRELVMAPLARMFPLITTAKAAGSGGILKALGLGNIKKSLDGYASQFGRGGFIGFLKAFGAIAAKAAGEGVVGLSSEAGEELLQGAVQRGASSVGTAMANGQTVGEAWGTIPWAEAVAGGVSDFVEAVADMGPAFLMQGIFLNAVPSMWGKYRYNARPDVKAYYERYEAAKAKGAVEDGDLPNEPTKAVQPQAEAPADQAAPQTTAQAEGQTSAQPAEQPASQTEEQPLPDTETAYDAERKEVEAAFGTEETQTEEEVPNTFSDYCYISGEDYDAYRKTLSAEDQAKLDAALGIDPNAEMLSTGEIMLRRHRYERNLGNFPGMAAALAENYRKDMSAMTHREAANVIAKVNENIIDAYEQDETPFGKDAHAAEADLAKRIEAMNVDSELSGKAAKVITHYAYRTASRMNEEGGSVKTSQILQNLKFKRREGEAQGAITVAWNPETQADETLGSVDISNDSLLNVVQTIVLGQHANASTIFHEFGHVMLNDLWHLAHMKNAPQSIKDELATVLRVLGVSDIESAFGVPLVTLDEATQERVRNAHEMFARSFEMYLRDGVAPTGLQKVFNRIREWLVDIYKTIRDLGFNEMLPRELRDVFDDLLMAPEHVYAPTGSAQARTQSQDSGGVNTFEQVAESQMSNEDLYVWRDAKTGLHDPEIARVLYNRKTLAGFLENFKKMPDEKDFVLAALAGLAKKGWYQRSAETIKFLFGNDAPRFTALLAATSPQNSVENNLHNALKIWVAWREWIKVYEAHPKLDDNGLPIPWRKLPELELRKEIINVMKAVVHKADLSDETSSSKKKSDSKAPSRDKQTNIEWGPVLEAWVNNTITALTAENAETIELSGTKVNSFMLNLRGNMEPVTNDTWMAHFLGFIDNPFNSISVYLAMNSRTRQAAKILTKLTGQKWTPAEVQETIWSWVRTIGNYGLELDKQTNAEYNKQKVKTGKLSFMPLRDILASGAITDKMVGATVDFDKLFTEGDGKTGYRSILEEAGYSERIAALEQRIADAERRGREPGTDGSAHSLSIDWKNPRFRGRADLFRIADRVDAAVRAGKQKTFYEKQTRQALKDIRRQYKAALAFRSGRGTLGGNTPEPSGPYTRGGSGVRNAVRPRAYTINLGDRKNPDKRTVHAIKYSPQSDVASRLSWSNIAAPHFYALSMDSVHIQESAKTFRDALIAAQKSQGDIGACVEVKDLKAYQNENWQLVLAEGGTAGFVVKDDGDIVSAFSFKGKTIVDGKLATDEYGKSLSVAPAMLLLAVQLGGNHLDCFDTVLPEVYSKMGFKAVSRCAFDEEEAPPGWNKDTFSKFNKGKPDVVFLVYDPNNSRLYKSGEGVMAANYGAASEIAAREIAKLREQSQALTQQPAQTFNQDAVANSIGDTEHGYGVAVNEKGQLVGRSNRFEQSAFQGSKVKGINQFDWQTFSGTGEGGAVHGKGTYAAQARSVAEGYREMLAPTELRFYKKDGTPIEDELVSLLNGIFSGKDFSSKKKKSLKGNKKIQEARDATNSRISNLEKFLASAQRALDFVNAAPDISVLEIVEQAQTELESSPDRNGPADFIMDAAHTAYIANRLGKTLTKNDLRRILESEIHLKSLDLETSKTKLNLLSQDLDSVYGEKHKGGALYELDVPENDVLLDEQKSFLKQPPEVQRMLKSLLHSLPREKLRAFALALNPNLLNDSELMELKNRLNWSYALDHLESHVAALRDPKAIPPMRINAENTLRGFGLTDEDLGRIREDADFAHAKVAEIRESAEQKIGDVGVAAIKKAEEKADLRAQKKLDGYVDSFGIKNGTEFFTGENIYWALSIALSEGHDVDQRAASLKLSDAGIKGITYDGMRDGRCFVIFDDSAIEIINRYDQTVRSTAERDAEYLAAVERGDMKTAKRMVDEAAQERLDRFNALQDDSNEPGYRYHRGPAPAKTVRRYAVLNVGPDGFRAAYAGNANPTPVGIWLDSVNVEGYASDLCFDDDGNPLIYIPGDTGAAQTAKYSPALLAKMRSDPVIAAKLKGKNLLLKRGGKHSADGPFFRQMNTTFDENGNKVKSPIKNGALPHNKLVFEIEYGMTEDGDLTDYVKEHGRRVKGKNQGLENIAPGQYYDFKTNSNAVGNWSIGGTFRIVRLVPYEEIVEQTAVKKKEYAEEAERLYADGKITKAQRDARVKAANGLQIQKWVHGYHPEDYGLSVETVDRMFEEGQKKKLLDAVTYDNNGNVIPLSQRFNPDISNILYQTARQNDQAQINMFKDHSLEDLYEEDQLADDRIAELERESEDAEFSRVDDASWRAVTLGDSEPPEWLTRSSIVADTPKRDELQLKARSALTAFIRSHGGLSYENVLGVWGKSEAEDLRKRDPGLFRKDSTLRFEEIPAEYAHETGEQVGDVNALYELLMSRPEGQTTGLHDVPFTDDNLAWMMYGMDDKDIVAYARQRRKTVQAELKTADEAAAPALRDELELIKEVISEMGGRRKRTVDPEQAVLKAEMKARQAEIREAEKRGRTEGRASERARASERIAALKEKHKARVAEIREQYKERMGEQRRKDREKVKLMREQQRQRDQMKKQIKRIIKHITKMGNDKHVRWGVKQELERLLAQYTLKNVSPKRLAKAQALADYVKENPDVRTEDFTRSEQELLHMLETTRLSEMKLEDLLKLESDVEEVHHRGRVEYEQWKQATDVRRAGMFEELLKSIGRIPQRSSKVVRDVRDLRKEYKGIKGMLQKAGDWTYAATLGAQRLFDWIGNGGGQYDSAMTKYFMDMVNEARDEELRHVLERRANIEGLMKDLGISFYDLSKSRVVDGEAYSVDQLLSIYALLKNQKGHDALIYGNFRGLGNQAEAHAARCVQALTGSERALADAIIEDFDKSFDRLNERFIDVYNEAMDKEENYTPMHRLEYSSRQGLVDAESAETLEGKAARAGQRAMLENGFLHKRQEINQNGQRAVDLGLVDLWSDQVSAQEHTAAFAKVAGDLGSVLGRAGGTDGRMTIGKAITLKYGTEAWKSVVGYTNLVIQNDRQIAHSALNSVTRAIGRHMSIAYLCGSLSTMLKQTLSLPRVLISAGFTQVFAEIGKFAIHPKEYIAEVKRLDPQMADRASNAFYKLIQIDPGKINELSYRYQQLLDLGMKHISLCDVVTASICWKAVYNACIKRNMSQQQAIREAQRAVALTQQTPQAKDQPALWQQSATGIAKLMMIFTNDSAQVWGMTMYDMAQRIKSGNVPRIAYNIAALTLGAMLLGMVTDGPPDDDDDENWLEWTGRVMTRQYISSVPVIGKELFAAYDSILNNKPTGNTSSALVAPFVKIMRGAKDMMSTDRSQYTKSGVTKFERGAWQLTEGFALLTGLFPVTGAKRTLTALRSDSVDDAFRAMLGMRRDVKRARRGMF